MDRKEIINSEAYWLSIFDIKLEIAVEKFRQDNGYNNLDEMSDALGLNKNILNNLFTDNAGVLSVNELIELCLKIGYAPKIEYVKLINIE